MPDDIYELPLLPAQSDAGYLDADREACDRPVIVDPLAWSRDGDTYPDDGIVLAGAGRRFRPFHRPGSGLRTWQAVCRGKNGVEAKRNIAYLDIASAHGWTWDASELSVYDALEWGWVHYKQRSTNSGRNYGVVVEVSDDRMVIWEHDTLAQAVRASIRGQVAAQVNEHALPVRRAQWEEERALGLVVEADEGDLEAIEALFG